MEGKDYIPSIKNRINGLDELRGIAVLFVLIAHWGLVWPCFADYYLGPIGVDLFFVISGFLIGKILIQSKGNEHYFRIFYVRRIFRILPLALVMIVIGTSIQWISQGNLGSLLYYCSFTQNYIPAFLNNIGESATILPLPGTSPMWSLAVEEQIYIVLPMVVGYSSRRHLPNLLCVIVMVGIYLSLSSYIKFGGGLYTNFHETTHRMHYLSLIHI